MAHFGNTISIYIYLQGTATVSLYKSNYKQYTALLKDA